MEDFRGNRLAVVVLVYEDEIRSVEGPGAGRSGAEGTALKPYTASGAVA